METIEIYQKVFSNYKSVLENADGVRVIDIYERAYNKMLEQGEYGSELHSAMNMWVLGKTLKKLKSLSKSIKEIGLERGDWNGRVATVLYGQWREMKDEIIHIDGYSKASAQKYAMMVLNVESVSTRLFGWNLLFTDCPSLFTNIDDIRIIKQLLNKGE